MTNFSNVGSNPIPDAPIPEDLTIHLTKKPEVKTEDVSTDNLTVSLEEVKDKDEVTLKEVEEDTGKTTFDKADYLLKKAGGDKSQYEVRIEIEGGNSAVLNKFTNPHGDEFYTASVKISIVDKNGNPVSGKDGKELSIRDTVYTNVQVDPEDEKANIEAKRLAKDMILVYCAATAGAASGKRTGEKTNELVIKQLQQGYLSVELEDIKGRKEVTGNFKVFDKDKDSLVPLPDYALKTSRQSEKIFKGNEGTEGSKYKAEEFWSKQWDRPIVMQDEYKMHQLTKTNLKDSTDPKLLDVSKYSAKHEKNLVDDFQNLRNSLLSFDHATIAPNVKDILDGKPVGAEKRLQEAKTRQRQAEHARDLKKAFENIRTKLFNQTPIEKKELELLKSNKHLLKFLEDKGVKNLDDLLNNAPIKMAEVAKHLHTYNATCIPSDQELDKKILEANQEIARLTKEANFEKAPVFDGVKNLHWMSAECDDKLKWLSDLQQNTALDENSKKDIATRMQTLTSLKKEINATITIVDPTGKFALKKQEKLEEKPIQPIPQQEKIEESQEIVQLKKSQSIFESKIASLKEEIPKIPDKIKEIDIELEKALSDKKKLSNPTDDDIKKADDNINKLEYSKQLLVDSKPALEEYLKNTIADLERTKQEIIAAQKPIQPTPEENK